MPEKMPEPSSLRIYRPLASDVELLVQARQCVAQAKAALRLPLPSTFLGESCLAARPLRSDQTPAPDAARHESVREPYDPHNA
jgi:hypothetical protein